MSLSPVLFIFISLLQVIYFTLIECPTGKFYKTSTSACTDCDKNTYKDTTGDEKSLCVQCDSGKTSPAGSKRKNDCTSSTATSLFVSPVFTT